MAHLTRSPTISVLRPLHDWSLTSRLSTAAAVGVVTMLALLGGFMLWAGHVVDQGRLADQTRFARAGLEEFLGRVPKEQQSVTIWDDAVQRLHAGDADWIRDNLGEWMFDYFGHNEVYILDAADQPVYAMEAGRTLPAQRFSRRADIVMPLVNTIRAEIAAAKPGDDIGRLGVTGMAREGDMPTLISIQPVVGSSPAVVVPHGQEYLHIAFRHVDADLLSKIGAHFQLDGLTLLAPSTHSDSAVSISDGNGRMLAFMAWNADKPGERLLLTALPGLLSAMCLSSAMVLILLLSFRRAAGELTASEAQTRFLAFHDTLTGLANRALFEDQLNRLVADRRSGSGEVALHMVDIDRFKTINDTLGHPAGDELIRLAAARLSEVARADDVVARLGGDEFAIIQSGARTEADAVAMAERLVATLSRPYLLLGKPVYSSGSVGTVFSREHGNTAPGDLLRRADIALYEAKAGGRARYALFRESMDDKVRERRQLEEELHLALEMGSQIVIEYQPLFAADGQTLAGAEALVRWDHPTRGRLLPEFFVSVAEENRLIDALGEMVLREAAEMALEARLPWVAVNVSPVQFRSDSFADTVLRILSETALPPERLQLEITEQALIDRADLVDRTLKRLREAGVRIALDDFGTGYSSLSYLRRYAIDKLKIDKSFVADLGNSADAEAIVRAMVDLAASMRLPVTAEGVETKEQMQRLTALGCTELQGFLLGSPMTRGQMQVLTQQAGLGRLRA